MHKLNTRLDYIISHEVAFITLYGNTINAKSIASKRAVEIYDAYHKIAKLTHYSERKQHLERLYNEALCLWCQAKIYGWI